MFEIDKSIVVVIDVQGRLAHMMHAKEDLFHHIRIMIQAAHIMQLPLLWVEQYPKGLGHTIPEIAELLTQQKAFEKNTFSAVGCDAFNQALIDSGRSQCIITGIETHVCVYQTVLDLLEKNFQVVVNQQAVSSRLESNKALGLQRMQSAGALISSTEMVLFELMRTAEYPHFRQISALLK
ncbi:isochorismatase family protein [Marinicella sp. W31]|uniref:isochorismatase family protein n=1 Tax=Marinicella sp. W31 TaxID=3023713 RepID=UPI003757A4FE